jgi:hypothetical protein
LANAQAASQRKTMFAVMAGTKVAMPLPLSVVSKIKKTANTDNAGFDGSADNNGISDGK